MAEHVNYPHNHDGDLYDCPPCEVIMAERCELFVSGDANGERCPACGEYIDYCQGHGPIGDPDGYAAIQAHERGDHSVCVSP